MDKKIAIRQLIEIGKYGRNMRLAAEGWDSQWQTLTAIILSARTRDEVTIEVCKKLFSRYKALNELAGAKLEEVSQIIRPVNFYRNKSKNIINCSKNLRDSFNGIVPHDIDLLISLPGVGRKTANVFLAEHEHDAIGVDTHVSYISQKLRWVKSNNPYKIEMELRKLFPRKYWNIINPYLVRFGKTYISRKQKSSILESISEIR
ncbi:endonuclease III [Candidatus Pacearchaeota archaeon]|nr:endonuclease III [Candidatus Pacearchaeota archaeon]